MTCRWAAGPLVGWVLLNPSSHDREIQPTRHRCVGFARAWGYAGIVQRNLFAFRATDPRELLTAEDPFGPENADYLARVGTEALTVAAWGSSPAVRLAPIIPSGDLYCIGINRDGSPRHPLHAPATSTLRRWPTGRPLDGCSVTLGTSGTAAPMP